MKPPVRLYTTPHCPFCLMAKRLLSQLDIAFEDVDVLRNPDLRDKVSREQANGWPTVPMIFVGETFIGGFNELQGLYQSGKLQKMLKDIA